jgi:hypothetical protein
MHEAHANGFSAEMLVAHYLCDAGMVVSIPLTHTGYDLLSDDNERIWRIQVKRAWPVKARVTDVGKRDRAGYAINLTSHKKGRAQKRMKLGRFDYLAAVCRVDLVYLIPIEELIRDGQIVRTIVIKPLDMLENTRADSRAAAERWEPWKNNFKLASK